MELVKAFGKGSIEGAAIGGITAIIVNTYDKIIRDNVPLGLRLVVDGMLGAGTIYLGFKGTEALDRYLEEE